MAVSSEKNIPTIMVNCFELYILPRILYHVTKISYTSEYEQYYFNTKILFIVYNRFTIRFFFFIIIIIYLILNSTNDPFAWYQKIINTKKSFVYDLCDLKIIMERYLLKNSTRLAG